MKGQGAWKLRDRPKCIKMSCNALETLKVLEKTQLQKESSFWRSRQSARGFEESKGLSIALLGTRLTGQRPTGVQKARSHGYTKADLDVASLHRVISTR